MEVLIKKAHCVLVLTSHQPKMCDHITPIWDGAKLSRLFVLVWGTSTTRLLRCMWGLIDDPLHGSFSLMKDIRVFL